MCGSSLLTYLLAIKLNTDGSPSRTMYVPVVLMIYVLHCTLARPCSLPSEPSCAGLSSARMGCARSPAQSTSSLCAAPSTAPQTFDGHRWCSGARGCALLLASSLVKSGEAIAGTAACHSCGPRRARRKAGRAPVEEAGLAAWWRRAAMA